MVQLIGHRGYPALYPENTILSFQKAFESGCNGIELDLRITKDNKVVVIHDKTLDRTTNGKGLVKDYTLKELRTLDAGKGEKIPELSEVLKVFNKELLLLEIKDSLEDSLRLCRETLKLVDGEKDLERIIFVSFDLDSLKTIRKMRPEAKTGLIFSKVWPPIDAPYFLPMYINAICPRRDRVDVNTASFALHNRLALYVWTIDTEEEVKKMLKYGVTGIVSNDPGRIRKYI